jgi:hypothetical protein
MSRYCMSRERCEAEAASRLTNRELGYVVGLLLIFRFRSRKTFAEILFYFLPSISKESSDCARQHHPWVHRSATTRPKPFYMFSVTLNLG